MNYCSNTAAARPTHTFRSRLHGLTACVLIMVFASAATADEISATAAMENPDNPLFLLSTSRGNIYIEMLPEEAPANTANVMALAQGEIELTDEAIDLPAFRHPLCAAYVFGRERGSLSEEMQARCQHIVKIPTKFCVNVSVACAITLYDRTLNFGGYPERPLMPGGPDASAGGPGKKFGAHR